MRITRRQIIGILSASLIFSGSAISQQPTPGPVATVEVKASAAEAEVGQQVKLTVQAKDAAGNIVKGEPSTYFAGPFDAAKVDDYGNVKLVAPGEVIVGAIFEGNGGNKFGITKIMVKPPAVKTIEITPVKSQLIVGASWQLNATARITSGDPRTGVPIKWISDTPAVATVDAAGVVTAVAPGAANIKATSGSATGSTAISVVKNTLRSLAIEPKSSTARTGDVVHLTARSSPEGSFATRWSVSGNGATIDSDGGFVPEQPGTYIVTASSGNLSANTSIVVTPRNLERELTLVARVPIKEFQGAEQWIIGNYAYYSTISDRFLVYDVSDPAHPKLTDTVNVDARLVNDISTTADGKILVISREGASNRKNGIAFYDTSDPAHPKLISEYTATVTGGVHSAFVDGHYVYLTDDATGSMRVIDFADAKNPKEVGRWQTESEIFSTVPSKQGDSIAGRYLHDLYVTFRTLVGREANTVGFTCPIL